MPSSWSQRGALSSLLRLLVVSLSISSSEAQKPAEYDYIVIGTGPGGGVVGSNLAKAGYSVLMLEAGDAEPGRGFGQYTPTVTWDFFVDHYPKDDPRNNQYSHLTWKTPQNRYWVGTTGAPAGSTLMGVYYPRGATLGGSSMINAMCTWFPPDSDWNYHAEVTGDATWKADNMRAIFQKIEKNNYLTRGAAGHGFDGFFQTQMGTMSQSKTGALQGNRVMAAYAKLFNMKDPMPQLLIKDPNNLSPDRDNTSSIYGLVTHQFANGNRYSSRNYIQDTQKATSNLTVSLTSLATKILFDTASKCGGSAEKPRATGVEYLFGKSLYSADNRKAANAKGEKRIAIARREVIVSGGAFNSPQLLLLSGIGAKEHLAQHNIPLIKDLPGVGQNLMDNQEMPIIGSGSAGSGMAGVAMVKTKHPAHNERDMFLMGGQGFLFRGFWPDNPVRTPTEVQNPYGVSMVKGSSVNKGGWVKLKSADPQDTPEINFNHYANGKEYDMGAMLDMVGWVRNIYKEIGITPREPPCTATIGADGLCSDKKQDEDWIHKQTFGHHPTSTNRIGGDNDPGAVLDSKFRVRGVSGLRVVDASAFARIPGVFPAVSTFTISQKASDDMIAELKAGTAVERCAAV